MIKYIIHKALLITSALILILTLHSCGAQKSTQSGMTEETARINYNRNQARLRSLYSHHLERVANQMTKAASKIFSPMTGRDFTSEVNLYDYEIIENQSEGYIACYATLTWQARSFFNSYNTCQLGGWLYYYPKLRRIDKSKAHFIWKTRNKHIQNISNSSDWKRIEKGIIIDLEE